MSIRKREWGPAHDRHLAWVVDYTDGEGKRRLKTFRTKKAAEDWKAETHIEIRDGVHVADRASVTVAKAAKLWLDHCETPTEYEPLERTTLNYYREHVNLHILPFLGRTKLSELTVPRIEAFKTELRKAGRSRQMVGKVTQSLGTLIGHAQRQGLVVRNVVSELRTSRRRQRAGGSQERHNGKLKVGIDIPTPEEVKAMLAAASPRWRLLLITAVFTGLRASELRGLRWQDVDLTKGELHVRQRADRYNKIGPPKSAAGERTVTLPGELVQQLREWKLRCPKKDGQLWLVFPTRKGTIVNHANLAARGLIPAVQKAGIVVPVLDAEGKPMRDADGRPKVKAKYTGMHALRHFHASWCINRKADGGLEIPAKVVQERLGHSSIKITLDVYGHLFPAGSDHNAELSTAAQRLLGLG